MLSALDLALRVWGSTYSFKAFRVCRILKPLLRVKAFAGIRAIFFSVVDGASALSAILFVTFLSLFVFTVVGVEFYMGSFRRRCAWMDTLELVVPGTWCKREAGEKMLAASSCGLLQICVDTQNPHNNLQSFDNTLSGLLMVFQIAAADNAHVVLHQMLQVRQT